MDKKRSNIKRKTVVFNLEDPLQERLYNHITQFKNFSYYGKSLIQNDMQQNTSNFKRTSKGGIEIKLGNSARQNS